VSAPAGPLALPATPLALPAPPLALPATPEAHAPPEARGLARDAVRLLVVPLPAGRLRHARFADLPRLLSPGDLLVVNTSATLPAALDATRAGGTAATLHLSTPDPQGGGDWIVELRTDGGARRLRDGRAGETLSLPAGGAARLRAPYRGARLWAASLSLPEPLPAYLARHGRPIRYAHVDGDWPLEAYENVYAAEPGSAEMPSAGRPFTPQLLARLAAHGIDVAPLVLHTGVSSLEAGERPYPERFRVPAATAARVNLARELGGRVVAVGTTAVRALESAAGEDGHVHADAGWTDLVIDSRVGVHAVDGLLTGFHDPGASHLELLEALAGRAPLERAYRAAARGGYLRHEFGDLALLLPAQRVRVTFCSPNGRSTSRPMRSAAPTASSCAGTTATSALSHSGVDTSSSAVASPPSPAGPSAIA
jgi:S-adenosylmethionine:tRNA ribosyltransferase-isomerase